MPGIDAPQAGSAVEYIAAVIGCVMHTRRGGKQAGLCLELAVCRKRHPEMGGIYGAGHLSFPLWRIGWEDD